MIEDEQDYEEYTRKRERAAERLQEQIAKDVVKQEQTLGEELIDGLRELSEAVATGKPLSETFTVRTVRFDQGEATEIRELRRIVEEPEAEPCEEWTST